jgi:succinoglycan biosynthesis transport protein ExoP
MKNSLRELNPDSLFQLVVRRWDLLLLIPLLTVLAAGLAWQVSPDRYQSTARLLIQDQQTINPFEKDMLEEWSAKQRMPLVESIFQSHSTSERVLRNLGRLDDAASPKEVNDAVERFQDTFKVLGLGGELVLIKVDAQTPEDAYEATSELVRVFTEQIHRPQRETVRASAAFFEDQLQQFRVDSGKINPSIGHLPEADKVSPDGDLSVRRALAQAEVRLAAAQQAVDASEAKLKLPGPRNSSASRQLRKELADARSKLIELKYHYGRNHPDLVAAKRRVRALQQAVNSQSKDSEETASATTASGLKASGAQPKLEKSAATKHYALLTELKEAAAEEELLRQRLVTEELSIYAAGSQVWTVEEPVIPTRSLTPPLWIVLLGSLFAGVVLALLALALFSAFDDALRGERELAEALGAPSLGRMPRGEA